METLTYSSGRASGCDSPGLLNQPPVGHKIWDSVRGLVECGRAGRLYQLVEHGAALKGEGQQALTVASVPCSKCASFSLVPVVRRKWMRCSRGEFLKPVIMVESAENLCSPIIRPPVTA